MRKLPHLRALLLTALCLCTEGCAQNPKPNPYFRQIANPKYDRVKWYHEWWGYCQEHGTLTNQTTERSTVEEWVETHNNQYHRNNGSIYWAKVYRLDE